MAIKDFKATAMSGSLTRLTTGETYLIAGSNVTISTGSDDRVTIASSGGNVSGSFNVPSPANFVTTASLSIAGVDGVTAVAGDIGTDVYFYVSGSKSSVVPRSNETGKIAVFGGDLVVSGTLYAERQVIEVDETVDGDFLVSGSAVISKELTLKGSKVVGSYAAAIHFDDSSHSAIVWDAGDAAIYESSGGLFLNADSKVMIMSGGATLSNNEAVATDVAFYVSGAKGSRNEAGRLKGTALFGGDVVMSGGLYVHGAETDAQGVLQAAITLNSGLASKIVWDSPGDSDPVECDAQIYESGGTLYLSGTTDVRVRASTGDVNIFSGDDVNIYPGDQFTVFGPNNVAGDVARFYYQKAGYPLTIMGLSDTGVEINPAKYSTLDFKVGTDNKASALLVSGSTDQVLILSGGAALSNNEAAAADVAFYVSGSTDSRGTTTKGTSLFGGDLVISGALHINPARGNNDVVFESDTLNKRLMWDASAEELKLGSNGNGVDFRAYGDSTSRNVHWQAYADKLYVGGNFEHRHGHAVFNEGGSSASDFRVETDTKTHAIFADADIDRVSFLSGAFVSGGDGDDVGFFVSGSTDSRGTSTRGTSLFGGDVVISGSLNAKQTQIIYGEYTANNSGREFLPLQSSASEVTSPSLYTQIVMPFKGRLRKVILRSSGTPGSTVVGFHRAQDGNANINAVAAQEITVNMSVANTSYVIFFPPGPTTSYGTGDIIGVSADATAFHAAVNFAIVVENEIF